MRRLSTLIISCCLSLSVYAGPPWMYDSGDRVPPGQAKKMKGNHYNADYRRGGPPPWAPAHGYRNKQGGTDYQYDDRRYYDRDEDHERISYEQDYERTTVEIGIRSGRCNRDTVGAILGGVVGGVVGNRIGKDSKDEQTRNAATVAGAIVGAVLGNRIGKHMDKLDEACTGQVLERAWEGQPVLWQNEQTGASYRVTPLRTYESGNRQCRTYRTDFRDGGQTGSSDGAACRNPDGSWESVGA